VSAYDVTLLRIQERVEFSGDPGAVWERLSDVGRIPEFWHGTKSISVLRRSDEPGREVVRAKAKFAFGGSGDVTITADSSSRTLTSEYTSGPFRGAQVVRIVGNSIEADWDVRFNGLFKLTSSWTGKHFASGTLHALERLAGKVVPEAMSLKRSTKKSPEQNRLHGEESEVDALGDFQHPFPASRYPY
jgi:hypothetical protein